MDCARRARSTWRLICAAPASLAALSACTLVACAGHSPSARASLLPLEAPTSIQVPASSVRHRALPAVNINVDDGISPDEAALLAVAGNLELRAYRSQLAVSRAQIIEAGILPNPVFSGALELPMAGATEGTSAGYSGGIEWELTALAGRSARRGAAAENQRAVELDIAWQEWQVAAQARATVYDIVALGEALGVAREAESLATQDAERLAEARKTELVTVLDLASARTAAAEAHVRSVDLQNELVSYHLLLVSLLGLAPEAQVRISSETVMPDQLQVPSFEELRAGLRERRIDLLALESGYKSQSLAYRAAVRARIPRMSIGLVEARDTADLITTGLALSIDLPVFDRHQGEIAAQDAGREQLLAEYQARVYQAESDIAALLAELRWIDESEQALQVQEPEQSQLVELLHQGLLSGVVDASDYYSAWTRLYELRLELIAKGQARMHARIKLQSASGVYEFPVAAQGDRE